MDELNTRPDIRRDYSGKRMKKGGEMVYTITINTETGKIKFEIKSYNDMKAQLSDILDSIVGLDEGIATITIAKENPASVN